MFGLLSCLCPVPLALAGPVATSAPTAGFVEWISVLCSTIHYGTTPVVRGQFKSVRVVKCISIDELGGFLAGSGRRRSGLVSQLFRHSQVPQISAWLRHLPCQMRSLRRGGSVFGDDEWIFHNL